MRDTVIYVFYYKAGENPVNSDIYRPIMAGNALCPNDCGFDGDDCGDSISKKNPYFSELTGIYWVWKNTRQQITGCCHYRRYFTAKPEPVDYLVKRLYQIIKGEYASRYSFIKTTQVKRFARRIITNAEIRRILSRYDAILPKPRIFPISVEAHYRANHNPADLETLESLIKSNCPDYLVSYHSVLSGNRLYANNMFILKENDFNRFMEWWFGCLFEFEKRSDLTKYVGDQQRVIGFIAERLLNVWFHHQDLKVKTLPIIFFRNMKYQ